MLLSGPGLLPLIANDRDRVESGTAASNAIAALTAFQTEPIECRRYFTTT